MNRASTALAVGFLVGLGAHVATAQGLGGTGLKSSGGVSSPLSIAVVDAGAMYVANNLGVGGTAYIEFVDAGQMNVVAQFCAQGATLCAAASGVTVANDFTVSGSNNAIFNSNLRVNGNVTIDGVTLVNGATAPTVTACSGGTVASVTLNNGTASIVFDVGTACAGESTAVLTMPTATSNGWFCTCDETTADHTPKQKTIPSGGGTVTLTNIQDSDATVDDWTDGTDVGCICIGY